MFSGFFFCFLQGKLSSKILFGLFFFKEFSLRTVWLIKISLKFSSFVSSVHNGAVAACLRLTCQNSSQLWNGTPWTVIQDSCEGSAETEEQEQLVVAFPPKKCCQAAWQFKGQIFNRNPWRTGRCGIMKKKRHITKQRCYCGFSLLLD